MKNSIHHYVRMSVVLTVTFLFSLQKIQAQTDLDGVMMTKNNLCVGLVYSSSQWNEYWEGTMKRNNENLGNVSSRMVAIMGNYGISKKLNLLFSLPYVQTKASQGTLHGQKGLQDLSLWVKWIPYETKIGKGLLSIYGLGGVSTPVSDYTPDFLPLSIGLQSKTLSLRAMADYQIGSWFTTLSGTYVIRDNIKIDRTSYYTTQLHTTNEVSMPNATYINFRTGYRSAHLVAEAMLDQWTTQGGFDISRNNMPFPSNRMNMTSLALNLKYSLHAVQGLSLIGGASRVLAGRNMGQSTSFNAGLFCVLDFSKKVNKTYTPINSK